VNTIGIKYEVENDIMVIRRVKERKNVSELSNIFDDGREILDKQMTRREEIHKIGRIFYFFARMRCVYRMSDEYHGVISSRRIVVAFVCTVKRWKGRSKVERLMGDRGEKRSSSDVAAGDA
jgi:hypothetical protein